MNKTQRIELAKKAYEGRLLTDPLPLDTYLRLLKAEGVQLSRTVPYTDLREARDELARTHLETYYEIYVPAEQVDWVQTMIDLGDIEIYP